MNHAQQKEGGAASRRPSANFIWRQEARTYAPLLWTFALWIAAGAFILTEKDARARMTVEANARAEAARAAALLNDRLNQLVREAAPLQQASTGDTLALSGSTRGVHFVTRNSALEVTSADTEASVKLNTRGAAAAKSALATQTTQVSAVHSGSASVADAVDIWVPSSQDSEAALFQMRVPRSILQDAVEHISKDADNLVFVDSQGRKVINLRSDGRDDVESGNQPSSSYVEAVSELSPLGFRIGAVDSLVTVSSDGRRNWICFLLVTSLLAAATVALKGSRLRAAGRAHNKRPPRFPSTNKTAAAARSGSEPETNHLISLSPAYPSSHPKEKDAVAKERLRMALDAGGICAWEWDRTKSSVHWRTSCRELFKQPSGAPELTARSILRRIFPHERRRLLHLVRTGLADNRPLTADIRLRRFDGELRWIALRAQPLLDPDGAVTGFVGIAHDITGQKQSLSHTDSLLREVSHRSKNMLALVLAMARLTGREAIDVKSHLKEFALRVSGLAASQDLIVAADWQHVDFHTLAFSEIEAVARSDAKRIKISGPPLLVTPEAAQTLGMILTELALNAVEHGALSVATGKAQLTWTFPGDGTIVITWRESDGPGYDSARPKGYGMSVVERFSTQGLKLHSQISDGPGDVTWTLRGPVSNIGSIPQESG